MFLRNLACVFSNWQCLLSVIFPQTSQASASVGPKLVYSQKEKQFSSDHPVSPSTAFLKIKHG